MRLVSSLFGLLLTFNVANAQTISPSPGAIDFNSYFLNLPAAGALASEDQIYVNQNGISRRATLGQVATLFGIILPDVDLNFEISSYVGGNCTSVAGCLSASNNGGYAQWADGHWSLFSANTARITDLGLLYETIATTNSLLWARDLTQSAWTKSNVTAVLTATGIDNTASAASTLTATSSNGTVCQSITLTSSPFGEFTFSIFVKRISGTGEIDISMETAPGHTGTVWGPITTGSDPLSNSWKRFRVTYENMSNPTVCIRIVTSGDSVAVDFAQIEPRVWPTSPILTTGTTATRQPDNISFVSTANTILNSGHVTAVVSGSGFDAGNFRHQISSPWLGGSIASAYAWQYAAMANFFNPGGGGSGAQPYAICGDINLIAENQSMALPVVWGVGWDDNGFIQSCDGGSLTYGNASVPADQTWYVGSSTAGPTTYVKRIRLFNSKLASPYLQAITSFTNQVVISDQSVSSGWGNYSSATSFPATIGGTLDPFSGGPTQNDYAFETGLKIYGITSPIQIGNIGNLIRFNMFANNCSNVDDCQVGNYGGSERTELDGATGASGTVQFAGATDAWFSFSFCVENGVPLTSNWFFTGQVHQTINPVGGASPPFAINTQIGEFMFVEWVNNGNQTYQRDGYFPLVRGKWMNAVMQLNFDPTGAVGKIKLWKNGIAWVNYTGITGQTPISGTQNYYWKFGIYRGQAPEYQAVRYANMTYSTSTLAAKIASPDPIPTGYGSACQ